MVNLLLSFAGQQLAEVIKYKYVAIPLVSIGLWGVQSVWRSLYEVTSDALAEVAVFANQTDNNRRFLEALTDLMVVPIHDGMIQTHIPLIADSSIVNITSTPVIQNPRLLQDLWYYKQTNKTTPAFNSAANLYILNVLASNVSTTARTHYQAMTLLSRTNSQTHLFLGHGDNSVGNTPLLTDGSHALVSSIVAFTEEEKAKVNLAMYNYWAFLEYVYDFQDEHHIKPGSKNLGLSESEVRLLSSDLVTAASMGVPLPKTADANAGEAVHARVPSALVSSLSTLFALMRGDVLWQWLVGEAVFLGLGYYLGKPYDRILTSAAFVSFLMNLFANLDYSGFPALNKFLGFDVLHYSPDPWTDGSAFWESGRNYVSTIVSVFAFSAALMLSSTRSTWTSSAKLAVFAGCCGLLLRNIPARWLEKIGYFFQPFIWLARMLGTGYQSTKQGIGAAQTIASVFTTLPLNA
jgi:hypothetical protein